MIAFDNSYARLPDRFFERVAGQVPDAPELIRLNESLAATLGLDVGFLRSQAGLDMLSGGRPPAGAEPIAMVYAGHQFGGWSPRLGDGRAMLLGEFVATDGVRRDLQLKGSGPTPYSRAGDGRAAIGPVLREYLVSEAMAALGVRTTRALAAVRTGELVYRERARPGAVFARIAESHVRFGTFQYFRSIGDLEALEALVGYVTARHYPDADGPLALLEAVTGRVADLVAHWQSIGFIHGVMNTDNMSIVGETIDYGPCAFMDTYHPGTKFSSIDTAGRYAYGNQPAIAHWNLVRLAEALLPLLADDPAEAIASARAVLERVPSLIETARIARFCRKLGLSQVQAEDAALVDDFLACLEDGGGDFTLAFRRLADPVPDGDRDAAGASVPAMLGGGPAIEAWLARWRARLASEPRPIETVLAGMRRASPAVIPRNHLVEAALDAAEAGDLLPFDRLHEVLSTPFEERPDSVRYGLPPDPDEVVRATFCGT